MKKVFIYLGAFLGLSLGIFLVVMGLRWQFFIQRPLPIPEEGIYVDILPGTSFYHIVKQLEEKGVMTHPDLFIKLAQTQNKADQFKAGEYFIKPGTTPTVLLNQMVKGLVVQYPFRIGEGWTIHDLKNYLNSFPKIKQTLDWNNEASIADTLSLPHSNLEGLFFPDTYYVTAHMTDKAILSKAAKQMDTILKKHWQNRAKELPYKSAYDALIMASIIEREAAVVDERPEVAGVFVRRLQKGMLLQADPTVIYGVGADYPGQLTKSLLKKDTPYNTYTRKGLPITPIAMPSEGSIRAALNPKEGKSLYFVSRGDGTHQFSNTLEEHNQAVRNYRKTQEN